MAPVTTDEYFLSVNSQESSVIDSWLPRIQHDDEYLELGLTFAPLSRGADADADADGECNEFRPLNDLGAVRLANALQHNTNLQSLDLSGNKIKSIGGVALARSLYHNTESRTALKSLNLAHNNIGDEGAMAFAQALKYNTTLSSLDLSLNKISIKGVLELLESLEDNSDVHVMSCLNLAGNLNGLCPEDMSKLVQNLCGVIDRCRIEVLDLQSDNNEGYADDNCTSFGDAKDADVWKILQLLYEVSHSDYTIEPYINLSDRYKLQSKSHILRKLTLPNCKRRQRNKMSLISLQLERILGFNSFYHPILELHDLLASQQSMNKYFDSNLPNNLQRDIHSGALIGLLPPPLLHNSQSKSIGVSCKEMPHVISFAAKHCELDTLWNTLRYRPDVFRYAGKSFRGKGVTGADCGACALL